MEVFHLITDEDNERGLLVIAPTTTQAVEFYNRSRFRDVCGEVVQAKVLAGHQVELQWDPECCTNEDIDLSTHFESDEYDFLTSTRPLQEWVRLLGPGILAIESGEGGCGNLGNGVFTCLRPAA